MAACSCNRVAKGRAREKAWGMQRMYKQRLVREGTAGEPAKHQTNDKLFPIGQGACCILSSLQLEQPRSPVSVHFLSSASPGLASPATCRCLTRSVSP
jgi:hypothetical protein